MHEPSSSVASSLKLTASLSVQPKTTSYSHEPSSVFASGVKLIAVSSIHPKTIICAPSQPENVPLNKYSNEEPEKTWAPHTYKWNSPFPAPLVNPSPYVSYKLNVMATSSGTQIESTYRVFCSSNPFMTINVSPSAEIKSQEVS